MKIKITLLLLICALSMGPLFGQKNSFGVYVGLNSSTIVYEGMRYNYEQSPGYTAGIQLTKYFGKKTSVRTGIAFEQKGAMSTSGFISSFFIIEETITHHLKLNYISLPLYFQYNFGKIVQPMFFVGMSFGYLVQQAEITNTNYTFIFPLHSIERYNRHDHSVILGAGLNIQFHEKIAVTLRAQYDYGLNVLGKNIAHNDSKNRSISMTYGVNFKI